MHTSGALKAHLETFNLNHVTLNIKPTLPKKFFHVKLEHQATSHQFAFLIKFCANKEKNIILIRHKMPTFVYNKLIEGRVIQVYFITRGNLVLV